MTRVLVVGGGIAGLWTAVRAAEAGLEVELVTKTRLVEGSTRRSIAPHGGASTGNTLRVKRFAAVLPLKQISSILRCRSKNVSKSLTTMLAGTIAESRLPSRSPAASTSQTAIPCARRRSRRSACGSSRFAPNSSPMMRQNALYGCA